MTFLVIDKQRFAYFSRLAPKAPTQSRSRQESGRVFGPNGVEFDLLRELWICGERHLGYWAQEMAVYEALCDLLRRARAG